MSANVGKCGKMSENVMKMSENVRKMSENVSNLSANLAVRNCLENVEKCWKKAENVRVMSGGGGRDLHRYDSLIRPQFRYNVIELPVNIFQEFFSLFWKWPGI